MLCVGVVSPCVRSPTTAERKNSDTRTHTMTSSVVVCVAVLLVSLVVQNSSAAAADDKQQRQSSPSTNDDGGNLTMTCSHTDDDRSRLVLVQRGSSETLKRSTVVPFYTWTIVKSFNFCKTVGNVNNNNIFIHINLAATIKC